VIVLNPAILASAVTIEGYSDAAVIQMLAVTTILSAAVATSVMALYAKRPFALAPGMGSNAFIAVTVVIGMGITWQTAFAAVVAEGCIFILITAFGARKYVIELLPEPVKFSAGAGIGMFLLFLGFQETGIVTSSDATIVTMASIPSSPVALLSVAGLFVTFVLYTRGVLGSIVIGIGGTTVAGWALTSGGVVPPGVLAPESLPTAQLDFTPLLGAFIQGLQSIEPASFVLVTAVLFFSDFAGTAGTLIGVSHIAGFLDEEGNLPDINKPLMADAVGTTVGGILGTSTVTTYIESSTGIEEGGRTGLTALVVAGLFVLSLLIVPLIAAIPLYASHLALILVGLIMLQGVGDIDWSKPTWSIPAGLTMLVMPLTMNPAYGLIAGMISFPVIKTAAGEYSQVRVGQIVIAALCVVYFYVELGGVLG
jgi:AGZA family xanthine/uracil permease-like MFS transporter